MPFCEDRSRNCYIGGYSLAGLFALWAACQKNVFQGVAAASPSVWFPGFAAYMDEKGIQCENIYLSLGDKEEKARNPVMATVGDRIRDMYEMLKKQEKTASWNGMRGITSETPIYGQQRRSPGYGRY